MHTNNMQESLFLGGTHFPSDQQEIVLCVKQNPCKECEDTFLTKFPLNIQAIRPCMGSINYISTLANVNSISDLTGAELCQAQVNLGIAKEDISG